jgi:tetratricopeptide (TPR) repeat protein
VKNAEATHPNAKSDVTDDEGKFTLHIIGLKSNTQTQIAINLSGIYHDFVVVNEKDLRDITLGRVTPIGVYISKKGELEQRRAEMVGINMRKFEECIEADKKRLQKELDELKFKNDYLNTRYRDIKDSLDIISKNEAKTLERITEYAQTMVTENLDIKDNNYVNAYNCFSRGEFDSVSYYLQEQELDLKHQKILQLQEEAKKEEKLAAILTEYVRLKKEHSENSMNELIKEWLLLARTHSMQNDYEKAMNFYGKAVHADTLNIDNLFEYAKYLHFIREYPKAENYYLKCLEKYRILEKENPNVYLVDIARILNRLAILHRAINEHQKALKEHEEALEIRRALAAENPKKYFVDLAETLNNLAILHTYFKEFTKALEKNEEALEIRRKLATENSKTYLVDVAQSLNNLGRLYYYIENYSKSLEEYEEALEINRKLAAENQKAYNKVALCLENLAILHKTIKEYPKALIEYTEALEINRTLAEENPKAYLETVAGVLNNLGNLHEAVKEYSKALEEYTEALEINRNLAIENPKVYLVNVAETLMNLGELYQNNKEYQKALKEYEESLTLFREFAAKNPEVYTEDIVWILGNISRCYLFINAYAQSEQYARKALELDRTDEQGKACIAHILLFQGHYSEAEKIYNELLPKMKELLREDLEKFENAGILPEERKADADKIKKILAN